MCEKLKELLQYIIQEGASDLHIVYGSLPRVRIQGDFHVLEAYTYEVLKPMMIEILSQEEQQILLEERELDTSFEVHGLSRFRANYYYTQGELSVVLRVIRLTPPTLHELKSPPIFYDILKRSRGMILFCGATGSGKSSSIAAMLHHVNENEKKHIITIEDPVEFVHTSRYSHFSHRCVKKDTKNYQNALKSALREDPDIIYVGEIRDNETLKLSLHAAQSGHLLFSTLHASSSVGAITRMVGSFEGNEQAHVRSQLAEVLLMVVTQTLVSSKEGGKIAAYEILLNTTAIANLIREAKFHQIENQMTLGGSQDMQLMNDALKKLVMMGQITRENALKASFTPSELQSKMGY